MNATNPAQHPDTSRNFSSISRIVRYYILTHWHQLGLASLSAISVVALNVVSVGIFAVLLNIVRAHYAQASGTTAAPAMDPVALLGAGDLMGSVESAASQLIGTYGIVPSLVFLSGSYLVMTVLTRLIMFANDYILLNVNQICAKDLTKDIFRHVLGLSLGFFHGAKTGDLVLRILKDPTSLIGSTFMMVNVVFSFLPISFFYLAVLMKLSPALTLIALVMFLAKSLTANFFGKRIRVFVSKSAYHSGENSAWLTDVLSSMMIVKVFSHIDREFSKFAEQIDVGSEYQHQRRVAESLNMTMQSALQSISSVSLVLAGVVMIVYGKIDVVALIIFVFVANRSQEPVRKLLDFIVAFHSARGVAGRVLEVAHEHPQVFDGPKRAAGFEVGIEFRNVTFHYRNGLPALRDVSFTLGKGEVVGVVGRSGAGKSTLLNLLLRFYEPQSGQILVDGEDIRSFTQSSYRHLFGMVPQDPSLFNLSIRDNIGYASDSGEIDDASLLQAARIAHVDEFAEQWEEGYDILIGDRGVRLSGGQKQRISLARAISCNPPVLVLDEATSSLDSHSETLIQDALDDFLKHKTAIIAAHRLSTLKRVDRIIVLDGGRIVEEGSHAQLLAMGGVYKELFTTQFNHAVDDGSSAAGQAAS